HYQWIQTSGVHKLQRAGRRQRIEHGELMVYHARVSDNARGQRINPFVKSVLLRKYKDLGFHGAWVYTTQDNIASQKGIEKAGWAFKEGYRALSFGNKLFIPLPGKLAEKP